MLARGVIELSVPSVAREAGVSVATVYRHFPTKSDLVHGLSRYLGQLQGTGFDLFTVHSFEELEARTLALLQRRAQLEPALRQALTHPELNRVRAETRELRAASADKAFAALLRALDPRDRRRARNMIVLLASSPTAAAWDLLIGTSPEDLASTMVWAIRRIVGEPSPDGSKPAPSRAARKGGP